MLTLHQDQECDPDTVEALISAAMTAMSRIADKEFASPSEVLSAQITLLDRTLRGIRKHQEPSERFIDVKEINRVLSDLIVDHGRLTH